MSAQARFSTQKRVPLKGSSRKAFDVSRVSGFVSPAKEGEPITVSVLLPRKTPIDPTVRLTREQFAAKLRLKGCEVHVRSGDRGIV